jgi:predicted PurR-regulated permease PerM
MNNKIIGFRASLQGMLGFFVALAIIGTLKLTSGFIQPFVIALLLSFILNPLVEFFVRIRIPRFFGIILVIVILLGFSVLIGLVMFESVNSLVAQYPKYQDRFFIVVDFFVETFNLPGDFITQFEIPRTLASLLVSVSSNLFGFLGNVALTMVFLLFIMMEKPFIKLKLREALKHERTEKIGKIFANINKQVGRYLVIKFFVSFLTAIIVFGTFSAVGVDFPFIWALLTFLFNFIPTIGSIIISVVSILFALIQFFPDWNPIILAGISMVTPQLLIGNILDPKLTGDSLNLSPVVILLALLLWGWLWGTSGLFLAVPLTVGIKIAFEYIPGLHFLGVLMGTGSRPAPIVADGKDTPIQDEVSEDHLE